MIKVTKWVLATKKPEYSDIKNRMYLNCVDDSFEVGDITHRGLVLCHTREGARNLGHGFFDLTPKKLTLTVED
jgi:hypothetical protein